MDSIWQWGLEFIRAIQSVHGPVLDTAFRAITFLGDEEFYLLILPLVYWCIDTRAGARLFLVFLPSSFLNALLKGVFCHPRPFVLDPSVQLAEAEGYCLPSGHAQGSVVLWGALAATLRKRWLWILATVLSLLIGFSRIFLGVHFPHSVLAGWSIGVVIVALYVLLERPISAFLLRAQLGAQLALAIVVPLLLLLLIPTPDSAVSLGALMGASVGLALAQRWARFSADGAWWQRVVRFLVGVLGVAALYVGLKAMFPSEGEALYFGLRTVRYSLVGLWGAFVAPWLFLRLRLARPAE